MSSQGGAEPGAHLPTYVGRKLSKWRLRTQASQRYETLSWSPAISGDSLTLQEGSGTRPFLLFLKGMASGPVTKTPYSFSLELAFSAEYEDASREGPTPLMRRSFVGTGPLLFVLREGVYVNKTRMEPPTRWSLDLNVLPVSQAAGQGAMEEEEEEGAGVQVRFDFTMDSYAFTESMLLQASQRYQLAKTAYARFRAFQQESRMMPPREDTGARTKRAWREKTFFREHFKSERLLHTEWIPKGVHIRTVFGATMPTTFRSVAMLLSGYLPDCVQVALYVVRGTLLPLGETGYVRPLNEMGIWNNDRVGHNTQEWERVTVSRKSKLRLIPGDSIVLVSQADYDRTAILDLTMHVRRRKTPLTAEQLSRSFHTEPTTLTQ